uniref:Adenylyl cyclase-associated protein (Trinotate prediction) n=1 Tax=Henneguya salminicola TaxID=69463 RepID=A0A6G3MF59_HENSL
MGCAWNMKGVDVGSTPSSISEPTTASKSTTTSQPPTGKLFSEINKGVGITGGLKKVDDSMKTHKNPNLRASAVVPDTKKSSSKTPTKTEITKTAKKPLFEEQGKRWLIENQKDQLTLQLDKGDKTYCAFIDSCVNSNLLINNKLNMVTILHCKGCQFQFKSGLISAVEITKCQNIKIFIDEFIPFIKLDACDSIQVHLSQKSLATQVMTNTSTSVNVHHVTAKNDYVESPIPELFVSYLKDDKLITEISHTT